MPCSHTGLIKLAEGGAGRRFSSASANPRSNHIPPPVSCYTLTCFTQKHRRVAEAGFALQSQLTLTGHNSGVVIQLVYTLFNSGVDA